MVRNHTTCRIFSMNLFLKKEYSWTNKTDTQGQVKEKRKYSVSHHFYSHLWKDDNPEFTFQVTVGDHFFDWGQTNYLFKVNTFCYNPSDDFMVSIYCQDSFTYSWTDFQSNLFKKSNILGQVRCKLLIEKKKKNSS